jgi:catalase
MFTTSSGCPVSKSGNTFSQTAGARGPVLLQDFHLLDKLRHFDRERIPERVVHAKGAGAHGEFTLTRDLSHLSCASFLQSPGQKTPVFARFSTVGGESGSADAERDPRGFALKFYTSQGNWDMTGNNTPVFFVRDPMKFPDFIHTQKRHPQTHCKCPDMFWDFLSLVPESLHQVMILFSNRGIPKSYRHMHGFSSHALKFVNAQGEVHYVKFHFKTKQGIETLNAQQAEALKGKDPDSATRDLFEAIARKEFPEWDVCIQCMTVEQLLHYQGPGNPLDVTKVWSQKDYPLISIGILTLNKNPSNYFAEVEQVAFSPGNTVPGIEASEDKMLQGRIFSYPDTHVHRLGPNFSLIPVNQPRVASMYNHQRDGLMRTDGNGGSAPNYEPNSYEQHQGTSQGQQGRGWAFAVGDAVGRWEVGVQDSDFVQPGALYAVMGEAERRALVANVAGSLGAAKREIQQRQVAHFKRANSELGARIEAALREPSL